MSKFKTWFSGLPKQGKAPIAITLALLSVALGALTFSPVQPVHAANTLPLTGLGGKCLDVQGGVAAAENKVQLYTCNSTVAQQWEQPGDGTIRNQGKCLDVQHANKAEKTLVWLFDCNGTGAQQWKLHSDGSLTSVLSGLCLDDQYGGTADRNPVWMYTCNTTDAQHWTVVASIQPAAVVTPAPITPVPAPVTPTQTPAPAAPSGDGYTNVDGNHVASPSSNPAGATAQCKDGTYSYSQNHSGTCSHHGGVATWL
jgi:hypothetical protein